MTAPVDDDRGQAYLRDTRHDRSHLVGGHMDWASQPDWFKTYPGAPRIRLPDLALDDSGLFDALARRRSVRAYGPEPLALGELGALLWAGAGITARRDGFAFRTAPSAGGLYPVEHYVVANDVEGLEQGLYHYEVLGRTLERLFAGDLRLSVARAALDQRIAAEAQAVFVWTAVLERSRWKYGERFVRYVLLDAGHIAQNVALAATALGLGTCQIAAFFDEEAAAILGVDPDVEPVIYMSTAGRLGDTRSTQPPLALG
jgi:SagB-type dehydrogenase family enzyme